MAFVGEIRAFTCNFIPQGWLACDGAVLPIPRYAALAHVIGNRFGGDGQTTFGLPDLRGRIPFGAGRSDYGQLCRFGDVDGAETTTLTDRHFPPHTHSAEVTATPSGPPLNVSVMVSTDEGTTPSPRDTYLARTTKGVETYGLPTAVPDVAIAGPAVKVTVADAEITIEPTGKPTPDPISLMPSHVAMNYCICHEGDIPTPPESNRSG